MDNFGEIVFYGIMILVILAATVARASKSMDDSTKSSTTKWGKKHLAAQAPEMNQTQDFMRMPSNDQKQDSNSFASMPYFSYENESIDDNFQNASRVTSNRPHATDFVQGKNEVWNMDDFDLRKAVICQTILQNNYI